MGFTLMFHAKTLIIDTKKQFMTAVLKTEGL